MVSDPIAEKLESRGLFLRAASRWLEVFYQCETEAGREWIRCRRNECLAKRVRAATLNDTFGDVAKAANETQQRMGLARPNGVAFRLKGK